ncbi:MAG TPA: hypothetical protein ENI94_09510 [Gammaproteobacteria bacterium]|nr:hypothetical protein [Gammaproteobacteria bacterium]
MMGIFAHFFNLLPTGHQPAAWARKTCPPYLLRQNEVVGFSCGASGKSSKFYEENRKKAVFAGF